MIPPWSFHPRLESGLLTLDPDESRHAHASRRLRPGDPIVLFDGLGSTACGTAAPPRNQKRPDRLLSVLVADVVRHDPPPRRLTLFVSACKGPRLDWLIEKCTELDASRIVFTHFQRSIVLPHPSRADKLRRTAIEACKQCRRPWLPDVSLGSSLADALATRDATLLLADPEPAGAPFFSWLLDNPSRSDVAIIIGPEGGLTSDESRLCRASGATPVLLGTRVLRVETAAIAACAIWSSAPS